MIIATAGHVDHGKTTLVKALTGIDTDRLAEEKARGMTIEPGFAYMDLGGGLPTAFVDVPGHERFVRNMLTGVASVDFALLVIAADDGPMPQTREHLAILDLLGIRQGAVALTKTDRVSPLRRQQVEEEIAALTAGSPLHSAPVFPVSAMTGDGVEALCAHLAVAAAGFPSRPVHGNFRLAVDRCFSLPGAGLVVTGAVFSGEVRAGEQLLVSPAGVPVRVRGLHVQNRVAERAVAGQRCALNLAGLELKRVAIERGDMIVAPRAHVPTERLDAQIRVVAAQPRSLAHWTPVRLHIGAADVNARVALLEGETKEIVPGTTVMAQLVLDRPVAALHGDRFILRDQAAQQTIAGGVIVDPFGAVRGRSKPERLQQLEAMKKDTAADALHSLLDISPDGVLLDAFVQAWNMNPMEVAALHASPTLVTFQDGDRKIGMSLSRWREMQAKLCAAVGSWHDDNPTGLGPSEPTLAAILGVRALSPAWRAACKALCDEGRLVRTGMAYCLRGFRPRLSPEDDSLLGRVSSVLQETGLRPPVVGVIAEKLEMDQENLLVFLERAAQLGHLVRVARNRFFLPSTLDALAGIAAQLAEESEQGLFDAAAYRDRSGIGRNLTIELLEFMDRAHITRYAGGRRKVVGFYAGDGSRGGALVRRSD